MANEKAETKTDRELIMQAYFQTCNEVLYWNNMTNGKINEVSKQLLGIAGIAIPLTGTIIASYKHIGPILGVILAFALFFLLASIVAGIKQMIIDSEFLKDYMVHNSKRAEALLNSRNLNLDEALTQAYISGETRKLQEQSNDPYFIIQGWCLSIGLLLISGVIVALVFLS